MGNPHFCCIWVCGREASTNLKVFHMVPYAVLSTEVDTDVLCIAFAGGAYDTY